MQTKRVSGAHRAGGGGYRRWFERVVRGVPALLAATASLCAGADTPAAFAWRTVNAEQGYAVEGRVSGDQTDARRAR